MSDNTAVRAAKLDKIFGTPVCAVLLAIFCNVLWGSAFPFIKLGYRLFSIDSGNTASIFCFAGVRFMLGSVLVLLGSILLQGKAPRLPRGRVAAECCALGLWQTTAQYAFYYIAVAMLTGAFGGILNSTQSFLGVIFAHFIYGNADRMTPAKTLGCALAAVVMLYLAFICGAGYILWALLMKNNPVSRIAIFGFVNPVVNVLLSAVLNGEPLFRWQYLAALVFVCVGIW